jgi:hypothetical protein
VDVLLLLLLLLLLPACTVSNVYDLCSSFSCQPHRSGGHMLLTAADAFTVSSNSDV